MPTSQAMGSAAIRGTAYVVGTWAAHSLVPPRGVTESSPDFRFRPALA